jgi:ACS family sodium-dependent inorganic phosphate cotransporter
VLAAGVALWSLFTGLTPQAAAGGAASLLAARVLLGVGEGVAFPAVHSLIGARRARGGGGRGEAVGAADTRVQLQAPTRRGVPQRARRPLPSRRQPPHPSSPPARNVPVERQSTAVGVVTAASYAGTALAFGVSPSLIARLGWPAVFYLFGALALLWLPLWFPIKVRRRGG